MTTRLRRAPALTMGFIFATKSLLDMRDIAPEGIDCKGSPCIEERRAKKCKTAKDAAGCVADPGR